jgi:hypothetical protein
MAPAPALTIVKTFGYRGAPEEWSNTYHFTGGDPASDSDWKDFADAVIALEKLAVGSYSTIIRAIGHKAGVAVADWTYDYAAHSEEVPCTGNASRVMPGDVAAWIRWTTDQKTSKGKPIFLRSYYHGVSADGNTAPALDSLNTTMKTAMETYGQHWVDGIGADSRKRCGPNGAVGLDKLASTYLTTRTLERRGRRP